MRVRFGLSIGSVSSRAELVATARRAEAQGYSTLSIADHLGFLSPMVAAAVVAQATDTLRVGPLTINNDFRHPAVLAQEAAAVDLLSDGRLELGMGAGHARNEYEAAGMAFAGGRTRVERLGESAAIVKRLLAGETLTFAGEHYEVTELTLGDSASPSGAEIPILIGGNGPRLMRMAAGVADIVQFTGFTRRGEGFDMTALATTGFAARRAVLEEAAGDRFPDIELSTLVQRAIVTDDREAEADQLVEKGYPSREAVLDSPHLLVGTVNQIADQIRSLHERYGLSYFTVFDQVGDGFEAVISELA